MFSNFKKIIFFLSIVHSSSSLLAQEVLDQSITTYKEYPVFSEVSPEHSNIFFKNLIQENNFINYFKYQYLYNGGGVAIGDVNNDGLPDIYFTGNMTLNRLYLNQGDLKFEDITAKARASYKNDWCTGVTMVDINNDGWLDIYVSASGWYEDPNVRKNILFVNDGNANENAGIPTFTDRAEEYGIDHSGYTTQSVFFDFDNDGDLDLYLANHPHIDKEEVSVFMKKVDNPPYENSDRLYRNDSADGNITFTDISLAAGITNYAHSLGVVASDFNNDGFVDIYVSNDFQDPDYLYKNTGKGVFINIMDEAIKHNAKFSMGVDASDFNNDGLIDIFAVEMLAEDNQRQKSNMASMNPREFWYVVKKGFGYQYMHNALQLNNGILDQDGKKSEITFSEISYLSGVASTDWSWSPLFADFDNDGWKDIFVTNGFRKDVLDKDFTKKFKELVKSKQVKYSDFKNEIPASTIPNYVFRNNHDLTFSKKSADWGIDAIMNSNGAAYADLDLDGDLDLVVNNIDTLAFIFKNNTAELNPNGCNYLRVKLQSSAPNQLGLGAKVMVKTADGNIQTQELSLTRGFQSSTEPILHFGVGSHKKVDWVKVIWKDQKYTFIDNVEANQVIKIDDKNSITDESQTASGPLLFQKANEKYNLYHKHEEIEIDDYAYQVLLPHKLSQNGPGIAVGDVNGDGLDDFYIGGSTGYEGILHMQQETGSFVPKAINDFSNHKLFEDMGAVFFDADNDGDQDLLVSSGSYGFEEMKGLFEKRLYLNDGKGNFKYDEFALPTMPSSGSNVSAGDYDGDGDLDLFIGGRVMHGKYPIAPHSYLLENQNGKFKDVTFDLAPKLANVGMVTSAIWTDYDDDKDLDLMVVGEWMPITIFINEEGSNFTPFVIPNSAGWWNSITGGDFDNDGDTDYLLGNLGTNSKNKATPELPFRVYGKDFDENGNFDIVLGYYNDGIHYPVRGLQCSSEQVPMIKEKIPTYNIFANSTLEDIYGSENLEESLQLEVQTFHSSILLNDGRGELDLLPLPNEAQVAPINGTLTEDFDQDGCLDILIVGNQYPVEVETGRYDAMKGLFLKGSCDGTFIPSPYRETGFHVDEDAKALSLLGIGKQKQPAILVSVNNGQTMIFAVNSERPFKTNTSDQYTKIIQLSNKKSRKYEFYIGSGYLSQQSNFYFEPTDE
jgi:hypothetical protein